MGVWRVTQVEMSEALRDELLDYEVRIDESDNDRYGAFKTGAHDYIGTALGPAVLVEPLPLGGIALN